MTSIGSRAVVAASNAARSLGKALDKLGSQLEVAKYTERLVPSTRFVAVDGVAPTVSERTAFVAPSANVIGNVSIGTNSSIWYGATVRGDVNKITIGQNSSIGDRAVIHVAKIQGDLPTEIADNVTIGAGAIIHACTIQNSCSIGANSQVLDGSVVESGTIVAPGSIVTPGTVVKGGSLYAGTPAKLVRKLTKEEVGQINNDAQETVQLASIHAFECFKDYKQLAEDEEEYEDNLIRDPSYPQRPKNDEDLYDEGDVMGQGAPGRIFDTTLSHPERAGELLEKKKS